MPTVTVPQLVARAKAIADIRDNFVTVAQWEYWATQERFALDLLLARSGWTLPLLDFPITVVGNEAGAFPINPTNGVMAVVCVYQYDSNGAIRMLEHQNSVDFLRRTPGYTSSPQGNSSYYRFSTATADGLTMNLFQEPRAAETYNVVYLAHPLGLAITDPSTYATATFGTADAFTVTALTVGTAGNDILIESTLSGTGEIDLLITGDITESFLNLATYEAAVAALNTSTLIGGATSPYTGAFGSGSEPVGSDTTAGGLDPVDLGKALSISYPMGWEERIVLGMARRALIKEESDIKAVDTEIGLWESRIEEACWDRVLSSSPSIRNVDRKHYGWTDRYSIPPYHLWTWM